MDHLLLGYVIGYRHISPLGVLQIRAAIHQFAQDFDLSEDDYPLDSALSRFYTLYDDLAEYDKADKIRWTRLKKRCK